MGLFTAETARIAAIKSHAPESARYLPKLPKVVAENIDDSAAISADQAAVEFRDRMLSRVREHASKLQDKIDVVLDRRDLDVKGMRDLADAVLKLESVEQRLSGRPLPGTLKPTSKPTKRQQSSFPEPIPCSPSVVPDATIGEPSPGPQVVTGDWQSQLF